MLWLQGIAQVYTPAQMPNVNKGNRFEFVSDPASLVSESTKKTVNAHLFALRDSTTAEMAVAIVPEIGDDTTIEEWSEELFRTWGLGKKDKDNGVLLVISPGSRQARIETGYGVEGLLPDAYCSQVIRTVIAPLMKENNLDEALLSSVDAIRMPLMDPAAAEEIRSTLKVYQNEDDVLDSSVLIAFLGIIAGMAFLICCILFIRNFVDMSRKKASRYDRARRWRKDRWYFLIGGICSAGAGLIFFFAAWAIYRRLRTKAVKCPMCGNKMRRLPEDEDNELLSDAQDLEERLKTVDYDVWECRHCGAVERYRYKYTQNTYQECPHCHTIAMYQVEDVIRIPATTRRAGNGEKVFECKYCHNQTRKPYVIPKKDDPTAALAAGAILGSAAGRSSGGGGFGGGFGGGMSGGGGASGRW
jgi:uncharacterized protein